MHIIPATTDTEAIERVVDSLRTGKILVVQTDTVYGLIADAANERAIERIIAIKGREEDKRMGVFLSFDFDLIGEWVEIPQSHRTLLEQRWPGAYTFVMRLRKGVELPYQHKTLGVRVPDHKQLLTVLREFGAPVIQTSVNRSGETPLIDPTEIVKYFESPYIPDRPDMLWDFGRCEAGKASIVIDITSDESITLRE